MNALVNKDFSFKREDFDRVRRLIYSHAGISLSDSKRQMVYSRLARRLRALQLNCFSEYLNRLEAENDPIEWEAFTNALTTNLTAFFREPHHFQHLTQHLHAIQGRSPIRIWSSAASTGEEPYSIAMTVADFFRRYQTPVQILASDLDTQVLEKAKKGIYTEDRAEKLSQDVLKKFFMRGKGQNAGLIRIRPQLVNMLEFRQINLLHDAWGIKPGLDVIFCRNVMIYFDKPTQRKILLRMAELLNPDGVLFVGHSESLYHVSDLFKSCGKTAYCLQKKGHL